MAVTKKAQAREELSTNPKLALAALEYLFAADYVSKKRLYYENFVRGFFFSMGTLVGAAVVATLVLWVLSLFDSFPFIEHISKAIESSVGR